MGNQLVVYTQHVLIDEMCGNSATEANGIKKVTCDTYLILHCTLLGCTCVFIDFCYTLAPHDFLSAPYNVLYTHNIIICERQQCVNTVFL